MHIYIITYSNKLFLKFYILILFGMFENVFLFRFSLKNIIILKNILDTNLYKYTNQ